MKTVLQKVSLVILLSFIMGGPLPVPTASAQDQTKACNSQADAKGLKGDERKSFMQDCLNKAGNQQLKDMSQKDKMDVCKSLADKKNLSGADRRSFLKDCMNKANPK